MSSAARSVRLPTFINKLTLSVEGRGQATASRAHLQPVERAGRSSIPAKPIQASINGTSSQLAGLSAPSDRYAAPVLDVSISA